jgi:serine-type D-Ala-D-Ala carboxypeptidase/endopeptidase (penicillin-binding protein 4)
MKQVLICRLKCCFIWLILLFGLSENSLSYAQKLPPAVAQLLRNHQLPDDAIGIVVLPINRGGKVQSIGKQTRWQAQRLMQPASTLKVVTSIVGLDLLGPAYGGSVSLRAAQTPIQGRLEGDLLLQGKGNPDFNRDALIQLLLKLKASGVNHIAGDLVLDRHWFSPARPDLNQPAFDETPEFRYNVIPDALSLNYNLTGLQLQADQAAVVASFNPPLDGVEILNRLAINDLACKDWEDQWRTPTVEKEGRAIVLSGAFPKNCSASTEVNILDRTIFTETLFRTAWSNLGGSWSGTAREAVVADLSRFERGVELGKLDSRPLSELVRDINKRSDNQVSRLIHATLGVKAPFNSAGELTTQIAADLAVTRWLQDKKIDAAGLIMDNGSGLSRAARITPLQLAQVLQVARRSPWAPEFLASLPIVGIDGSMRNRLPNHAATARARIKTGGLRNVASVAGYVTDQAGKDWVVVGLINHDKGAGRVGREILDALIEWVAR